MEILIADDDRVGALKLRRALEKLGHTVLVVDDGAQAWEHVREREVTLVISDWMMPELDGPELCRRIRDRDGGLYTYFILLTSRDGRDDRLEGLAAGADDFLTKPFDTAELVARLNVARRILDMQEQLRNQAMQLRELHRSLARQNAMLSDLATTDGLTGLSNRRHLNAVLEPALALAVRRRQPLSLLMLDVDHFKGYNDAFGHPAGDEALRLVANILRENVRDHDLVARYGGEEFVVLMPYTDVEEACSIAGRLRESIVGQDWPLRPVTASFGVSTSGRSTSSSEMLLQQADEALYRSKRQGRDRITHHDDPLDTRRESRRDLDRSRPASTR